MPGRHAKPIELHLLGGNKRHLTKAEIEHRQKSEVKFGDHKLTCPKYLKANKEAYAKWREVIKIYKDVDFVASGDVGLLARYCMAHAEYLDLVNHRAQVSHIEIDNGENEVIAEALSERYGTLRAAKLFEKIDYIMSVSGLLAIDKAINAKMDALVKMEDRLFLNPLAKVKNVPKEPEKKKADPLAERGFGNI